MNLVVVHGFISTFCSTVEGTLSQFMPTCARKYQFYPFAFSDQRFVTGNSNHQAMKVILSASCFEIVQAFSGRARWSRDGLMESCTCCPCPCHRAGPPPPADPETPLSLRSHPLTLDPLLTRTWHDDHVMGVTFGAGARPFLRKFKELLRGRTDLDFCAFVSRKMKFTQREMIAQSWFLCRTRPVHLNRFFLC